MFTDNPDIAHATSVQEKYTEQLLTKPHVLGVSLGETVLDENCKTTPAIVVLVDSKVPVYQIAAKDRIPNSLEGVPVIVREIGTIEAF